MRRVALAACLLCASCGGETIVELEVNDLIGQLDPEVRSLILLREFRNTTVGVAIEGVDPEAFGRAQEELWVEGKSEAEPVTYAAVVFDRSLEELRIPESTLPEGAPTSPGLMIGPAYFQSVSNGPGTWERRGGDAWPTWLKDFRSDALPRYCAEGFEVEIIDVEPGTRVRQLEKLTEDVALVLTTTTPQLRLLSPLEQDVAGSLVNLNDRVPGFEDAIRDMNVTAVTTGPGEEIWVATSSSVPDATLRCGPRDNRTPCPYNYGVLWRGSTSEPLELVTLTPHPEMPKSATTSPGLISDLAVDPREPNVVYVVTRRNQLLSYDLRTEDWTIIRAKITNEQPRRLLVFENQLFSAAIEVAPKVERLALPRRGLEEPTEVPTVNRPAGGELKTLDETPLGLLAVRQTSLFQLTTQIWQPPPVDGFEVVEGDNEDEGVVPSQEMYRAVSWGDGFFLTGNFDSVVQYSKVVGYCPSVSGLLGGESRIDSALSFDETLVFGRRFEENGTLSVVVPR